MEQKILDFMEEKFRYEYPGVLFCPERLMIQVGTGANASGSFKVYLGKGRKQKGEKIRGYFTCADDRMQIEPLTFSSEEETISFTFKNNSCLPLEEEEGKIVLISSHGEFTLPYLIKREEEKLFYEKEEISSLEDFFALAYQDFKAAVALFSDENFEKRLLNGRSEAALVRKALLFSTDRFQALEEFLCYSGRKERVRLSAKQKEYEVHLAGSQNQFKLILRKNTWGYVRAKVECLGSALSLSKIELSERDFVGDICEILIEVDKEKLNGRHYRSELLVSDAYHHFSLPLHIIPIEEIKPSFFVERRPISEIRQAIKDFYQYRLGNGSKKEMATSLRKALRGKKEGEREESLYLNGYLEYLDGEDEKVRSLLSENERWEKTPLAGAIHLYLCFLLAEEKEKQVLTRKMEDLAKDFGVMEAYLFILKMEERFIGNPSRQLELLSKLYDVGMNRIFLFFETWLLIDENPSLFKKMNGLMEKTFMKAMRYGLPVKKELVEKFVEASMELRDYHPFVLSVLKRFYEDRQDDLILTAIVSQLLKADKTYADATFYLRKGIKKGIKLTGIYELYVKSLKEGEEIEPSVFTYFLYGNSLGAGAKLLLFSDLMRKKKEVRYLELYKKYEKKIESFALEELKRNEVGSLSLVLYKELIKDRNFVKNAGRHLSNLIYKNHLSSLPEFAKEAVIFHDGMEKPMRYNIINRSAFVDQLREGSICLVSDAEGRLFLTENPASEALFRYEIHSERLFQEGDRHILTLLQLFCEENRSQRERYFKVCECILESGLTNQAYKLRARKEMIGHFDADKDDGRLEAALENLDFTDFDRKDGRFLSEVIFKNGLEAHFYQAATYYGMKYLKAEDLKTFISYALRGRKKENLALILSACKRIIKENIGGDEVFLFLSEKLEAEASVMFDLMRRLRDRKLLGIGFKERLVEQLLFSEELTREREEEVYDFYEECKPALRKAVLNYKCYEWLLKERELGSFMERKISEEALKSKSLLPVISYLKLLSKKTVLLVEEVEFASVRLFRLVEEGIILPFFRDFIGKCKVPAEIENLNFVYCKADASDEVEIHYRFLIEGNEEDSQMMTEWMKNAYLGIFVKPFLIFADERIKYYISTPSESDEEILKRGELFIDPEQLLMEDGRKSLYSEINQIFLAKYIDDKAALEQYMKTYILQRETLSEIFRIKF